LAITATEASSDFAKIAVLWAILSAKIVHISEIEHHSKYLRHYFLSEQNRRQEKLDSAECRTSRDRQRFIESIGTGARSAHGDLTLSNPTSDKITRLPKSILSAQSKPAFI